MSGTHDTNFRSYVSAQGVTISEFDGPVDPLAYDDILKFSACDTVTVENVAIHGGRENCVDIVRGRCYTLRNSALIPSKVGAAAVVIKGGADTYVIDRCFINNGTETGIELGQFDNYWYPGRKPTRNGLICNSRTTDDSPLIVTCWNAEPPHVEGGNVKVVRVPWLKWFPYFCWRYVAIRAAKLIPWLMCLGLLGCQLPQWRVAQAKVPAPVKESPAKVEAERQAADLIARKIERPPELKPVAVQLSASLGAPEKPITQPDIAKASTQAADELREQIAKLQKQVEKQNAYLAKYAGKEIEGTGFNLFGPSMGVVVIGLIALGVLCPPAMTLMFFVLRRVKSTAANLVTGIESFSQEEPDAAAKLKDGLSKIMDSTHKKLVRKLKVSTP